KPHSSWASSCSTGQPHLRRDLTSSIPSRARTRYTVRKPPRIGGDQEPFLGPERGRRLVKGQLGGPLWPQKASPCIGSLPNRARQWQSASAPSSPQRIPAPLSRCPTTLLQADATGPDPVCHPWLATRG